MSLCYCQPVVAGLSIVLMRPRLYFYLHVDQRPRCSAIWYPETLLPLLVQKPYYECLPLHSKRVQNESFNIQTTYAYTLGTDKLMVPALWGYIRIGMVKQFCEMLFLNVKDDGYEAWYCGTKEEIPTLPWQMSQEND